MYTTPNCKEHSVSSHRDLRQDRTYSQSIGEDQANTTAPLWTTARFNARGDVHSQWRTTHLVKVEHQVQLTHIAKELIQHLHKEMYSLQVCQRVVISVDAGTEEQTSISTVDDLLRAAELDEVGLVFLVAGCYEAVDFALELYLIFVGVGAVPFREAGLASVRWACQHCPNAVEEIGLLAVLYEDK